ncbi:MAG: hypothetical protein FI737_07385 [SAR202 cluster bacterium]|nr:hypothetical protein [Dehalococcoidia bacterium]MQF88893.1 hypothetical protein [SAR202 cluster bacterium]
MTEETPNSHDLNKLTRWYEGLASASGGTFPVCALFLASGEDNRAHDIFRVYRTAFAELDAGFHDLVIFGQHGMSSTCAALIAGLGLSGLQTSSLVLISGDIAVFHSTGLPSGTLAEGQAEVDGDDVPWRVALEAIKQAVGKKSEISLDGIDGFKRMDSTGEALADLVGKVKLQVEED